MNLKRMWINQPSTLQKYHKLHDVNVLVEDIPKREKYTRIFHISGIVHSEEVDSNILEDGWRSNFIISFIQEKDNIRDKEIAEYKKLMQDYYDPFTAEHDKLVNDNFWLKVALFFTIPTLLGFIAFSIFEGYLLYVK
jgi:hypothetical protein